VQAGLAFYFSQRFYPVQHEYGRIVRVIAAALLAFMIARALPAMSPAFGIVARGTIVVVVMCALLWLTRFFNAEELRGLSALRKRERRPPIATTETTELAGEIVSVELPEEGAVKLGRN
jgi:hypothetical protein